jgi:hypothetical protein
VKENVPEGGKPPIPNNFYMSAPPHGSVGAQQKRTELGNNFMVMVTPSF